MTEGCAISMPELDLTYLTATPEQVFINGRKWLEEQNKIFNEIYIKFTKEKHAYDN